MPRRVNQPPEEEVLRRYEEVKAANPDIKARVRLLDRMLEGTEWQLSDRRLGAILRRQEARHEEAKSQGAVTVPSFFEVKTAIDGVSGNTASPLAPVNPQGVPSTTHPSLAFHDTSNNGPSSSGPGGLAPSDPSKNPTKTPATLTPAASRMLLSEGTAGSLISAIPGAGQSSIVPGHIPSATGVSFPPNLSNAKLIADIQVSQPTAIANNGSSANIQLPVRTTSNAISSGNPHLNLFTGKQGAGTSGDSQAILPNAYQDGAQVSRQLDAVTGPEAEVASPPAVPPIDLPLTSAIEQALWSFENAPGPLSTPREDAREVQMNYRAKSNRSFKIYAPGDHDYGIVLNVDRAMFLNKAFSKLMAFPRPWRVEDQTNLAHTEELHAVWDYYIAAGKRCGVPRADVVIQFQSEWGVPAFMMPTPAVELEEPLASQRKKKWEFIYTDMKMNALRRNPKAQQFFPLDADRRPLWDNGTDDEFAMLVYEIDRGDDGVDRLIPELSSKSTWRDEIAQFFDFNSFEETQDA